LESQFKYLLSKVLFGGKSQHRRGEGGEFGTGVPFLKGRGPEKEKVSSKRKQEWYDQKKTFSTGGALLGTREDP